MDHCNCHEGAESSHHWYDAITSYLFSVELNSIGVIVTLFFIGLTASFTHCIGMCGPIAMGQMSMRLISSTQKPNFLTKIKAAAAIPYYLGKASTYVVLTMIALLITNEIKHAPNILIFQSVFLFTMGIVFIVIAINNTIPTFNFKFDKLIIQKVKYLSPYGISGYFMGMLLGLIPCGIVYAAIFATLSYTTNIYLAASAMFIFGMTTIPGLFIVSLIGQQIIATNKWLFKLFFVITMLLNSFLMFSYFFKIVSKI